jgi:ABC-type bacteriocin/lantibiotic exporter with double-glycine peptidase domain
LKRRRRSSRPERKGAAKAGGQIATARDLYRYVWRVSGRAQLLLSLLSVAVFLLELAPLELQRRIVNRAVDGEGFRMIAVLCLLYVGVVLTQGGLKLALNVYRGSVGEAASRQLRSEPKLVEIAHAGDERDPKEQGVAISVIVSEVEAVGGFVGVAFSDPVLNGGILLSVFGYMLVVQPLLAIVAVALFIPQVLFIPVLQEAINRRTARRIQTLRSISVDIVGGPDEPAGMNEASYRERIAEVYRLNMQIYRRKYLMTFLINLLHHLAIVGILGVGGWLLLRGETEVGTIVAFISGLTRMNDPWNDLVDFFRNLMNAGVKYRLIAGVLQKGPGGSVPGSAG